MSQARGRGPRRATLIVSGIAVVIAAVAALSLSPRHAARPASDDAATEPAAATPAPDSANGAPEAPAAPNVARADRAAPVASAPPGPAAVADLTPPPPSLAPTAAVAANAPAPAEASDDDGTASAAAAKPDAPKLSAEEQSLADAVGDTRHADSDAAGGNTSE